MAKLGFCVGILFVLASCGGGGGASLVGVTAPPPEQLVVQQLFEGCGVDALADWRQVEDAPLSLFEAGSPIPPSMFLTVVSTKEAYFVWQTNLDLDIPIDLEVKTEFQDAQGQPLLPVPQDAFVTALMGDLTTLDTLLAAMPVGSRLVHTVTTPKQQPGEPIISATFVHTLGAGGVIASTSGSYTGDDGAGCVSTLSWNGLGLPTPAVGAGPVAGQLVIDLAVGTSDQLSGSLTYAGLLPGTLELSRNGGLQYRYDYDPVSGTVTPQP